MLTTVRAVGASNAIRAAARRKYSDNVNVSRYPLPGYNTVFNVVPQGYAMTQERFGVLHRIREAGWFMAIPFVDKITNVVDMREITIPITPQVGTTMDNVSVSAGGTLYVRVVDPKLFCYEIRRPLLAIQTLAISSMRSAIGSVDLDTLFHNRSILNASIMETMSGEKISQWGMMCHRYELTEVTADDAVQDAMDLQSVAERDRRKEVLNAQADKTAMIRRSEGKKQHYINIAEGKKQQQILEAEGKKQQQILEAEGTREAAILCAEGEQMAIARIASVVNTAEGRRGQNFLLAQQYIEGMTAALPNAKFNTVFIPKDLGDLPKVLGAATGILGGVAEKPE